MQAVADLVNTGREDKECAKLLGQYWIDFGESPKGGRSLYVNVQDEVDLAGQFVLDLRFEGAVVAAVHTGMFIEFMIADFFQEVVFFQEMIVNTVDFTGSGRPGCSGDDSLEARREFFQQAVAEGCFSAACWP